MILWKSQHGYIRASSRQSVQKTTPSHIEFVADQPFLVLLFLGIFMHVLLQVHRRNADSCRSGHSSGQFEILHSL